jgi:hypothetical protein
VYSASPNPLASRNGTDYSQGFIWGAGSILTAIWLFFIVPETKGLTLEQMDYLYAEGTPTRKFKGFQFPAEILQSAEKGANGPIVIETTTCRLGTPGNGSSKNPTHAR